MLMQNFGVTNREHYGMLWYFWSGQLCFLTLNLCLQAYQWNHSRWILTSESSLLDAFGAFHSAQNTGIFDQKSNGTNQCGSVRAKYLRPPLKVVCINRSCHFCRLDCRNVPVHLTKLLFPLPLICMILFASTITKSAMACVGSVQPECTVPLGTWNSWDFKPQFFPNRKRPFLLVPELSSELQGFGGMPSRGNTPQKPALSN